MVSLKKIRIGLASAPLALLALAGCEEIQIIETGENQTTVVADINIDPAKVVCDPFQNNPNFPAAGRDHGIVGRLGYIPDGQPGATRYQDFEDRGNWVDADLFLSDLNVPTRRFDLGFFNQEGDMLVDQTGDKLYENFTLKMETRIQLKDDDVEGDYQFAVMSDDGSVVEIDRGNGWEVLIDNDLQTATRLRGSMQRVHLSRGDGLPMRVKYYQGPRYHIALILLWRPYPAAGGAEARFGQSGNDLWFNYNVTPSVPKDPYFELLNRGWRPVSPRNFQLPAHIAANPCTPPAPQFRVAQMCTAGQFVAKPTLKLGLSIDAVDASPAATIRGNFNALGIALIEYTDAEIIARKPQTDGITVLAISRKATLQPVTPEYIAAVRQFVVEGGSLIGEYDGAALAFTDLGTGQPILNNFNPSLRLFDGTIAGGGALLPVESSRTYVIDAQHPLMAGLPGNFLNGVRQAFAMTGYDDRWLSVHAQFISTGFGNLVPAGTYPSVMSARCGPGRVVLFTMNHFQVMNQAPVSTMVTNALNWSIGQ